MENYCQCFRRMMVSRLYDYESADVLAFDRSVVVVIEVGEEQHPSYSDRQWEDTQTEYLRWVEDLRPRLAEMETRVASERGSKVMHRSVAASYFVQTSFESDYESEAAVFHNLDSVEVSGCLWEDCCRIFGMEGRRAVAVVAQM